MVRISEIKEHMEVIGADGVHVGTVDKVEGDRIKLTKADSGQGSHQGHHHFLSTGLVADIEGNKVRLSATGARVVMFTIFDPGGKGIYGTVRGRMAIFNEWVREIADRHDATVVDMWRMRDIEIAGVMDADRMHLNRHGHTHMAHAVLEAIGVEHALEPVRVPPMPLLPRRQQWAANAQWAREFLVPWVHRRVTGRSSGDTVSPKRPDLSRVG